MGGGGGGRGGDGNAPVGNCPIFFKTGLKRVLGKWGLRVINGVSTN